MPRSGRPSRHCCTNRVGRSSDFRVRPARPSHRPSRNRGERQWSSKKNWANLDKGSVTAAGPSRFRTGVPCSSAGESTTAGQPPTHNAHSVAIPRPIVKSSPRLLRDLRRAAHCAQTGSQQNRRTGNAFSNCVARHRLRQPIFPDFAGSSRKSGRVAIFRQDSLPDDEYLVEPPARNPEGGRIARSVGVPRNRAATVEHAPVSYQPIIRVTGG